MRHICSTKLNKTKKTGPSTDACGAPNNLYKKVKMPVLIYTNVFEHCVKSVRIWNYSGSYFPAFGLNTERYSASFHIQSECEKLRTRQTPNTDTFHAVDHINNKVSIF